MQLQLQQLRKRAGYRSREDFADALGINPRTYKTWETGERRFNFEQACMMADLLHCSLDELAGRSQFVGSYSDGRQAAINESFSSLSEQGKVAALGAVKGIEAAECAQSDAGEGAQVVQGYTRRTA